MEMKKELLEKEKACELEDSALDCVSGGDDSFPPIDVPVPGGAPTISDKKTVIVGASAEIPFP